MVDINAIVEQLSKIRSSYIPHVDMPINFTDDWGEFWDYENDLIRILLYSTAKVMEQYEKTNKMSEKAKTIKEQFDEMMKICEGECVSCDKVTTVHSLCIDCILELSDQHLEGKMPSAEEIIEICNKDKKVVTDHDAIFISGMYYGAALLKQRILKENDTSEEKYSNNKNQEINS